MQDNSSSVFVAIIGRPNVGKSSLLNRLVGEKTAIVSPKPQTTRTRITGVLTKAPVQYVFSDTPGLHNPRTKLGGRMAKAAKDSVAEGDVVLMLFEPTTPLNEVEREMVEALKNGGTTAIAAINKIDTIREGMVLLEKRAELEALNVFEEVRVVSAESGEGCSELLEVLARHAAEGPHFFDENVFTDQPEKQLVAELVREKLLLHMEKEIPHGTAVEVERFKEISKNGKDVIEIDVTIYCEKKSHKGMIIGKNGQKLKQIATEARRDCEDLLGTKVFLQCWVKVRDGWRDNENMLNNMGFKL